MEDLVTTTCSCIQWRTRDISKFIYDKHLSLGWCPAQTGYQHLYVFFFYSWNKLNRLPLTTANATTFVVLEARGKVEIIKIQCHGYCVNFNFRLWFILFQQALSGIVLCLKRKMTGEISPKTFVFVTRHCFCWFESRQWSPSIWFIFY